MGSHHDLWRNGAAGASFDERFFQERGYSRAPLLVQWMATEQCSLKCAHCLAGGSQPRELRGESRGEQLALPEVARLMDQVAALGVQQLLITGGEPLERPDLPEVVALLGERNIRWSLNTARMPDGPCRAAMEAHPPGFVAVSLDGPQRHHDHHRGEQGAHRQAMEAIGYFSRIVSHGQVAAGTTITRQSVGLLEQTFSDVVASGAAQWGLHVVFPEGRAAGSPELFLTRRQMRSLMTFAAQKRPHFPITLGDEFGYLGSWEPHLRGEPFFCGAGRTQCVVLADGEVVPCTTVDRTVSAGNVRTRSLAEVWQEGFADLRRPRLTERCRGCGYADACGGGCWLQRRHGEHCYRDLWSRPRDLATAAGMAVCLGLASCAGADTRGAQPADPREPRPVAERPVDRRVTRAPARRAPARRAAAPKLVRIGKNDALEVLMLRWMRTRTWGRSRITMAAVKQQVNKTLGADPAGKYLLARLGAKQPAVLSKRLAAIRAALQTRQRSLSFASLLLRDVAEWCLDETPAPKRTPADRKAIRVTLRALEKRTRQWRKEVFAQKLSPFLTRDFGVARPFMMLKSGRLRISDPAVAVVAAKRYGLTGARRRHVAATFLRGQPIGRSMRLEFTVAPGKKLERLTSTQKTPVRGKAHLDVFDLLRVDSSGNVGVGLVVGKLTLKVALPAGAELTWADVMRLAYEQHRAILDPWARGGPRGGANLALQIPALRSQLAKLPDQGKTAQQHHLLTWRLLYAWMY